MKTPIVTSVIETAKESILPISDALRMLLRIEPVTNNLLYNILNNQFVRSLSHILCQS